MSEVSAEMPARKKRKSPAGTATNDLIYSAVLGFNYDQFPQILQLYVSPGSVVADTTYGRGVFWKHVPEGRYEVRATDLQMGVDACALPYEAASVDCVVFDPPYMHSDGGGAHNNHQGFDTCYKNDARARVDTQVRGLRGHAAVVDLYVRAGVEALRVLKPKGIYIVKCQDEVHANEQRLTHVELINAYTAMGYKVEDLFVLVIPRRPGVSRQLRQYHARKLHSYFVVLRKPRKLTPSLPVRGT